MAVSGCLVCSWFLSPALCPTAPSWLRLLWVFFAFLGCEQSELWNCSFCRSSWASGRLPTLFPTDAFLIFFGLPCRAHQARIPQDRSESPALGQALWALWVWVSVLGITMCIMSVCIFIMPLPYRDSQPWGEPQTTGGSFRILRHWMRVSVTCPFARPQWTLPSDTAWCFLIC